jgi:hypothetical protein
MNLVKRISFIAAVGAGAFGCFGGDPNQNSMSTTDGAVVVGTGGTTGGGGTSGGGFNQNTPIAGVALTTFDTTSSGFSFSTYSEAANLAVNNGGTAPTLMWNGADGSPSPGALQITAPYSAANQYVDIQSPNQSTDASSSAPMCMGCKDWTGAKLHVRVKVDTGSTFTGQIEPYADTGTGYAFVGTSVNVMPGAGWHDYTVDLKNAMTNPNKGLSQVILYGVHIGTGTAPTATPTPVTFEIDSFSIEGAPGTTGAGGAAGGASGAAGSTGIGGSGAHDAGSGG